MNKLLKLTILSTAFITSSMASQTVLEPGSSLTLNREFKMDAGGKIFNGTTIVVDEEAGGDFGAISGANAEIINYKAPFLVHTDQENVYKVLQADGKVVDENGDTYAVPEAYRNDLTIVENEKSDILQNFSKEKNTQDVTIDTEAGTSSPVFEMPISELQVGDLALALNPTFVGDAESSYNIRLLGDSKYTSLSASQTENITVIESNSNFSNYRGTIQISKNDFTTPDDTRVELKIGDTKELWNAEIYKGGSLFIPSDKEVVIRGTVHAHNAKTDNYNEFGILDICGKATIAKGATVIIGDSE